MNSATVLWLRLQTSAWASTGRQIIRTSHSPFRSAPQSLVEHLLTAAQVKMAAGVERVGL